MVVWRIWYRRNRWVHFKVAVPLCGVIDWAKSFLGELQAVKQPPGADSGLCHSASSCLHPARWKKPDHGCYKHNSDASTDYPNKLVGLGAIIRNDQGLVMAASTRKIRAGISVDSAEALAVLSGIQLAHEAGIYPIVVESDSKGVVDLLNGSGKSRTELGLIVSRICSHPSSRSIISFSFCSEGVSCCSSCFV
ncbi:hypothetical protein ACOSQ3_030439 [Xanthoceras sorbifolium]